VGAPLLDLAACDRLLPSRCASRGCKIDWFSLIFRALAE
jgi:hypothetical protein